jgi:formamidopyrimidine-DNA glycosylase
MPELPDIEAYLAALRPRVIGETLQAATLRSPFLLRTVDPPLARIEGLRVYDLLRIGKRIVLGFESDLFLVFHLMVLGRLHWLASGARVGASALATFAFASGTLTLTESGRKHRAALHVVQGRAALAAFNRGGLEVLGAAREAFAQALRRENHTLKRALTDPRIFSGIGNAFSDEILHRARLSPLQRTAELPDQTIARLYDATQSILGEWTARLVTEAKARFPEKVTAFKPGLAVHGRFRQPCPVCDAPIQRIVYAENETNYCARCQTGGRILADRLLSRLLREDWPRTLSELEDPARGE